MGEATNMVDTNSLVLAGIDESSLSQAVCDYAYWIARTADAPLHLLHTIEHGRNPAVSDLTGAIGLGSSEELLKELTEVEQNRSRLLIKQGNLMLKEAKQQAKISGVNQVYSSQRHGTLPEALVDLEPQIRVLVIGIRGEQHEADQTGIGTQLEATIRALHKPILVVNGGFSEPKHVMLAFDDSPAARKALEMVAWSPLFKQAKCDLVTVTSDPGVVPEYQQQALNRLSESGVEAKAVQLHGRIDEALADYQLRESIDLMVMGAFSHTRIRGLLMGSFTAKMLQKTKKPLLLLR